MIGMIHNWLRMLRKTESEPETKANMECICAPKEGPILGEDGSNEV